MSFTNETVCLTKVAMADFILEAGCEEARVPSKLWFRLMEGEQSVVKELWLECLANAAPALLDEGYGKVNVEDEDMSLVDMVDWKRVPPSLFICVVLGLDCLVTTHDGNTLGVISTVESDDAEELAFLTRMRPLFDYLAIDGLVWFQVNLTKEEVEGLNMGHKKAIVQDIREMLDDTDFECGWMHNWVIESNPIEEVADLSNPTVTTFRQDSTKTMNPTKTLNSTFTDNVTKTVNPALNTNSTKTINPVNNLGHTITTTK